MKWQNGVNWRPAFITNFELIHNMNQCTFLPEETKNK